MQDFRRMQRLNGRSVLDLHTAGCTFRHGQVGVVSADRAEQLLADIHGNRVSLLLEAERPGHAATLGCHLFHFDSRDGT